MAALVFCVLTRGYEVLLLEGFLHYLDCFFQLVWLAYPAVLYELHLFAFLNQYVAYLIVTL
jgi:hypothetical protein